MTLPELKKLVKTIVEETVTKEYVKKLIEDNINNVNWNKIVIVYDNSIAQSVLSKTEKLLLEYQKYKNIPKTNFKYRFDAGNTNTKTKDHIVIFANKNQELYAINRDGTGHDGSKGIKVPNKILKFLPTIGFKPPKDGIIEWKTIGKDIDYNAIKIDLSKLLLD